MTTTLTSMNPYLLASVVGVVLVILGLLGLFAVITLSQPVSIGLAIVGILLVLVGGVGSRRGV